MSRMLRDAKKRQARMAVDGLWSDSAKAELKRLVNAGELPKRKRTTAVRAELGGTAGSKEVQLPLWGEAGGR